MTHSVLKSSADEESYPSNLSEVRTVTRGTKGYYDPVTLVINEGFLAKPTFKTLNCRVLTR